MPVVSQSMTRPIVPVGAITVTWALRRPWRSASASALSQAAAPPDERLVGAVRGVERHRRMVQALVAAGLAQGRAVVVAQDPQHRLAVGGIAGERAQRLGHLGRDRVGGAGHQGGDRAAERAARSLS